MLTNYKILGEVYSTIDAPKTGKGISIRKDYLHILITEFNSGFFEVIVLDYRFNFPEVIFKDDFDKRSELIMITNNFVTNYIKE